MDSVAFVGITRGDGSGSHRGTNTELMKGQKQAFHYLLSDQHLPSAPSFRLTHSALCMAAGLAPVHQWECDASDRSTCNYPPTPPSPPSDWTAGPLVTRESPPTTEPVSL